ncbi:MAG: hypothetical protein WAW07_11690 [Bacteroidales bacterium]
MKKIVTLLLLAAIFVLPLSAQRTKDALCLRNGSVIYGKLQEISDNTYTIRTYDGSLFKFSSDEVDRFKKETPLYDGRKTGGIGFSPEIGLLVGAPDNEYATPVSFNLILSYTAATRNIIGIGSGIEYFNSGYVPVFAEYKLLMNEHKTAPFVFFRGGTLIHSGGDGGTDPTNDYLRKDYKGGGMLTLGTGISWSNEEMETYLSFAYRYAQTSYRQANYDTQTYTYKINWNRLEIKIGFRF